MLQIEYDGMVINSGLIFAGVFDPRHFATSQSSCKIISVFISMMLSVTDNSTDDNNKFKFKRLI